MEHNRVIYTRPYDAEVEYLESSGTQFIDTGINSRQGIVIECTFQYTVLDLSKKIFGSSVYYNDNQLPDYGTLMYFGIYKTNVSDSEWHSYMGGNNPSNITPDTDVHTVIYDTIQRKTFLDEDFLVAGSLGTLKKTPPIGLWDNGSNHSKSRIFKCSISLNGVMLRDFIPVRIGQIGYMYDKVSGKLFGNKGTGNFTLGPDVANPIPNIRRVFRFGNKRFVMPISYDLEEGIDYQKYDWLRAEIPNNKNMMSLPINSKNFEFKRNFIQVFNSGYFSTSDSDGIYSYYTTSERNIKIWSANARTTIYNSQAIGSGILTIISNNNGVTISSATKTDSPPFYGNPMSIPFNNVSASNSIQLTSSIKENGVIRYIPCQLLHSIPTYIDANGKARQVGECGMIDLISGKFYGNVVNAGTFTVENNN